MIQPGGTTIDYVVDGQNRRVGKEVGGVRQWALLYRDSLNPIAQLDGDGNLVSAFVYGTRPNIPDYFTQNGRVYRIVADHLGSPRLVIDAEGGTVAERIDYGPWGQVTRRDITGPAGYVPIPFTFAGGIGDVDTGLVRFGARDYDPMTGRWTRKDPMKFMSGESNAYRYSATDPLNAIDINGLWYVDLGVSAGWLLGASGGILINDAGVYAYAGFGAISPGGGITLAGSSANVTPGAWANQLQIAWVGSVAKGLTGTKYATPGEQDFWEFGVSFPFLPTASMMKVKTFQDPLITWEDLSRWLFGIVGRDQDMYLCSAQ